MGYYQGNPQVVGTSAINVSANLPPQTQSTLTQKACSARAMAAALVDLLLQVRDRLTPSNAGPPTGNIKAAPPDHVLFAVEGTEQELKECHAIVNDILSKL